MIQADIFPRSPAFRTNIVTLGGQAITTVDQDHDDAIETALGKVGLKIVER